MIRRCFRSSVVVGRRSLFGSFHVSALFEFGGLEVD
jgi:hypothetical protein